MNKKVSAPNNVMHVSKNAYSDAIVNRLVSGFQLALNDERESLTGQTAINFAFLSAIRNEGLPKTEVAVISWMSETEQDKAKMPMVLDAVSSLTDILKKNSVINIARYAEILLEVGDQPLDVRRRLYRILTRQSDNYRWVQHLSNDEEFVNDDLIDWMRVRHQADNATAAQSFSNISMKIIYQVLKREVDRTSVLVYWGEFLKFYPRPAFSETNKISETVGKNAQFYKSGQAAIKNLVRTIGEPTSNQISSSSKKVAKG